VSGVPIGTPLYMAPEQARGERVDGRSDVYALGVVCQEMLSGVVPFTGESPLAVLMAHLTLPPPRLSQTCPELSTELDEPILHMLAKEAAGRPPSASAAIEELVRAAERAGHVVPAGMPQLPRPPVTVVAYPGGELHDDDTDDSFGSNGLATSLRRGSNGNAVHLARTDRAPGQRARNWPFLALLVALAAGVLYLGSSALRGPSRAPAVAPAPLSGVASASANGTAPAAPTAALPAPTAALPAPTAALPAPTAALPAPTAPAALTAPVVAGAAPSPAPAAAAPSPAPAAAAPSPAPAAAATEGAPASATPTSPPSPAPTAAPSVPLSVPPAVPPTPVVPAAAEAAAGPTSSKPAKPSAAAPAEAQRRVQVTVRGAPAGARIWLGTTALGEAPGPVALPFGQAPVELRVTAPGHSPRTLKVTPQQDQSVEVKLQKRTPRKDSSDLESPF
jgi:serine/threonine-protein kinase